MDAEPSNGSPSPERPRPPLGFVRDLALAMELPFVLIACILVGGGLGYLLDKKLATTPLFVLLLGFLGFGAGIWEIIRRVKSVKK